MTKPRPRTWELKITSEWVRDVLVLAPVGRISSRSAGLLRQAVVAALGERGTFVLDLAGVDYLSSAALAALHAAYGVEGETRFVLCGVRDPVRIALDLAAVSLPAELTRDAAIAKALQRA